MLFLIFPNKSDQEVKSVTPAAKALKTCGFIITHSLKIMSPNAQCLLLQSMSAETQLRTYDMQLQQFIPLFQDWGCSFVLWHEQFKTYPHKDQLQDYENQWKQWQDQMNATNAHLRERVATLSAMVPFPSSQYNSGTMGQYGQYSGQDQQQQQQSVTLGMQHSPIAVGTRPQAPTSTGFGTQSDSSAPPPVGGPGPAGIVRPPGPPPVQQQNFNGIRGPR